MASPNEPAVFLDFDGSYRYEQRLLSALDHRWIDFSRQRGTSLYCSPEAFQTIEARLSELPADSLTFLGSGNYHYVALILMKKIKVPFTLILFDHHTDLKQGRIGSLLSCGSWVRHAVTGLAHLKKVVIVGPRPEGLQSESAAIRTCVVTIPERRIPDERFMTALIPTPVVRISIDKDVLSEKDAKTNWDQGHMSLDQLCRLVQIIARVKIVAGVDICGEWPIRPHERFKAQTRRWIASNERSNLRLAKQFFPLMKKAERPPNH